MIHEIKKGTNRFPVLLVEAIPQNKIIIAEFKNEPGHYYMVQSSNGFFDYVLLKISECTEMSLMEYTQDSLLDGDKFNLYMLDSLKDFADLEAENIKLKSENDKLKEIESIVLGVIARRPHSDNEIFERILDVIKGQKLEK